MSWLGPNQLHGISCHRFGDIQDQVHQLEERWSRPRSGRLPALSQIWTRKRPLRTLAFRLVDENWFPVKKFLSVNFLRAISRVHLAFKSFVLTLPGETREFPFNAQQLNGNTRRRCDAGWEKVLQMKLIFFPLSINVDDLLIFPFLVFHFPASENRKNFPISYFLLFIYMLYPSCM